MMKAAIMAGGSGTRLWPLSREDQPKQFHALIGAESLLQQTFARLHRLLAPEAIFVCTLDRYADATLRQLPALPPENLIVEPAARNTGPAIGLVAATLQHRFGDCVVATVAADHAVRRPEAFATALASAGSLVAADPERIVTIGIRPTRPETGYGYIEAGELLGAAGTEPAYRVVQFVEKPSLETAERYVASGRYLWNASYFIWSSRWMLGLFDRFLPDVAATLAEITAHLGTARVGEVVAEAYRKMPRVAVDTGIMEKAPNLVVIPVEMGWNDVGSWDAIHEELQETAGGVAAVGPHVGLDDRNTLVYSTGRLVATMGLDNIVVVVTDDAVLVCDRNRSQDLKKLMDGLRLAGREDVI
jgi:mannose-1-phosphate guanylyltransferase